MTMITDAQIKYLRKIINNEFNVDILSKSRKQNYVNARLVYSYILRQKGVGLVRIANSLNKNHATILYLCNNAPFYLKQDVDLNNRYENCYSLFDSEHLPVVEYTRRELLKAYLHLETKYDRLLQTNRNLKKTIEELELSKNY